MAWKKRKVFRHQFYYLVNTGNILNWKHFLSFDRARACTLSLISKMQPVLPSGQIRPSEDIVFFSCTPPCPVFLPLLNKQCIKGFHLQPLQKELATEHYSILFCSGKHLQGCPTQNLNALFLASLSAHSKACTFLRELINMKYRPDYLKMLGLLCMAELCISSERKPSIQFRPRASLLIGPRANSGFVFGRPTMQWMTQRENVASMVPLMMHSCAKRCRTASWVDLTISAKSRSSARTHCHPELIWPTQERAVATNFLQWRATLTADWHSSAEKKAPLQKFLTRILSKNLFGFYLHRNGCWSDKWHDIRRTNLLIYVTAHSPMSNADWFEKWCCNN